MLKSLLIIVVLSALCSGQSEKAPDVWEPLRYFVGSWEGTGKGQPGKSKVEREYQFVLNGGFLQVKNKSVFARHRLNPKGEVHEDVGLFSYDRNRKQFVLRQRRVEGFVNNYAFDPAASDGKTLTFISEGIGNIAPGWRAKETYKILNANEFIETFELAAPGKEFAIYAESHFKRKR